MIPPRPSPPSLSFSPFLVSLLLSSLSPFRRALVSHSYLQDATGAGLSQFVDLAVAQGAVGTVLSTDAEDDAVFGFVTALPLRFLARDNQCAKVRADDSRLSLVARSAVGRLIFVFSFKVLLPL